MGKNCTIKGYLFGQLCTALNRVDSIADADILVVPTECDERTIGGLDAFHSNQKRVVRRLNAGECEKLLSNRLVVTTDESGGFCIPDPEYQGQCLDVYARINSVPLPNHSVKKVPLKPPVCLYLGKYRPIRLGDTWYLLVMIPQQVWCDIKRLADAWTILGRVVTDDTGDPLGNLTVTAFDTDIFQHDNLGTDVTAGNGFFRIDYLGEDYRKGILINIELIGGPDIFFEVKDSGGGDVYIESPSRGRSTDRKDRGPCFCVELRAQVREEDAPPVGVTAWTGIGEDFSIPDSLTLKDFDADGYAGAPKYAITGVPKMAGSITYVAPNTAPVTGFVSNLGNPIRYRFLISELPTTNTIPPTKVPEADFTRIVGAGPAQDVDLFYTFKAGEIVRYSPYKKLDVMGTIDEVDSEGWMDLNKSLLRVFMNPAEQDLAPGEPPLTPADMSDFIFSWSRGSLMRINTRKLTTVTDVTPSVTAGQAVDPAKMMTIEKYAIRFEVKAFNDTAVTSVPMPGHGTQLDAIIINNTREVRSVAMTEHQSETACTPLSGDIHVAYTVHHPHIMDARLTVVSNDGSYSQSLVDAPMNLPVSNNTSPAISHMYNPSLAVPAGLHKCTYKVRLYCRLRLHDGDNADLENFSLTTFYWE